MKNVECIVRVIVGIVMTGNDTDQIIQENFDSV